MTVREAYKILSRDCMPEFPGITYLDDAKASYEKDCPKEEIPFHEYICKYAGKLCGKDNEVYEEEKRCFRWKYLAEGLLVAAMGFAVVEAVYFFLYWFLNGEMAFRFVKYYQENRLLFGFMLAMEFAAPFSLSVINNVWSEINSIPRADSDLYLITPHFYSAEKMVTDSVLLFSFFTVISQIFVFVARALSVLFVRFVGMVSEIPVGMKVLFAVAMFIGVIVGVVKGLRTGVATFFGVIIGTILFEIFLAILFVVLVELFPMLLAIGVVMEFIAGISVPVFVIIGELD